MLCPRGGDRLGRREGGRHVENSENSEGGGSDAEHDSWADGAGGATTRQLAEKMQLSWQLQYVVASGRVFLEKTTTVMQITNRQQLPAYSVRMFDMYRIARANRDGHEQGRSR